MESRHWVSSSEKQKRSYGCEDLKSMDLKEILLGRIYALKTGRTVYLSA